MKLAEVRRVHPAMEWHTCDVDDATRLSAFAAPACRHARSGLRGASTGGGNRHAHADPGRRQGDETHVGRNRDAPRDARPRRGRFGAHPRIRSPSECLNSTRDFWDGLSRVRARKPAQLSARSSRANGNQTAPSGSDSTGVGIRDGHGRRFLHQEHIQEAPG